MAERDVLVAITLPEPYGSELQGWRERLGDPHASSVAPHVTLLPPTGVAPGGLDDVEEQLSGIASETAPFAVRLRGTGTFRPVSPVVFVRLAQGSSECAQLAGQIHDCLAVVAGYPYHPHVTVAHDLGDAQLDVALAALSAYEAAFRVEGFSLFGRGTDGRWQAQRHLCLGGSPLADPRPGEARS